MTQHQRRPAVAGVKRRLDVVAAGGGTPTLLGEQVPASTISARGDVAWSPDGTKIAVAFAPGGSMAEGYMLASAHMNGQVQVSGTLDRFAWAEDTLLGFWQEGAFGGASAGEAFDVRCDRSTMTQNDLDNGRLVCLIGVAIIKPAEFVIFRIGQKTADARA